MKECLKNKRDAGMIDAAGFRSNVGIILANDEGQVFLGKRVGQSDAWQFPQGGVNEGETAEEALFRELYEETGLTRTDVEVLGSTRGWLRYRLPTRYQRKNTHPRCVGQAQKWFLLRLLADESSIRFDRAARPEFDGWSWVSYWYPITNVISFKRDVYRRALSELAPKLLGTLRKKSG
jgi:putative (di)nucleoside polyphosphate hydrolase